MYESSGNAGMGGFMFLLILGAYLYFAFAQFKVAQKLRHNNAWFAFIPILNTVQLIQMAAKPMIWLLFLLVPIVNIVCFAILWMEVAKATGHSPVVGFLTIVPLLGFISIGIMAFGSGQMPVPPNSPQPKQPANVG